MAAIQMLEDPVMKNVGPTISRRAQNPGDNQLLKGAGVISADGHWEITEDIFLPRFPARLKDKAPRVWLDRFWRLGYPTTQFVNVGAKSSELMENLFNDGLYNLDVRLQQMLAEGVSREVVFPQSVLLFLGWPDLEVREWVLRIYNEYVAERSAIHPGRFYGVGVLSNWWDPTKVGDAVRQITDLGLKTFMLPINPGKDLQGQELSFGSEAMEPVWQAIAESGLPICFHVAENFDVEGRGKLGAYLLNAFAPFRKPLGQLMFGGVFDRHPSLQVVFAEGGLSWVPPALQDAEMIHDTYDSLLEPRALQRPSYYWSRNCHATFQNDRLGLSMLKYIGADRVMWASDYPHTEGSFGFSYSSRETITEFASDDDAAKILGGNAAKLFNI